MDALEEAPGAGLAQVLQMSWPASLTMLNSTMMKFVDGLMVSRIGPQPFAAQFIAGITSFVPESLLMGLLTVVNTYVSQNLGAGRSRRTGQYAWAGLFIALIAAAAMAPLALAARPLFSFIGSLSQTGRPDPVMVGLETTYFRYMILGAAMALSTQVLQQFFYGVHRPRVVFAVSLAANGFNVGANAVLIFGLMGFPAMGLRGAAMGTVLSWGLQAAILLAIFLHPHTARPFGTWQVWAVRRRQCVEILRLGWPAGVQLCNDIATWAVFTSVLVGYFGQVHLTASTAAMRWMGLSFMPTIGIGIATTALVGRQIGRGRPDLARRRAHTALLAAMVYMGVCGIAFWLLRYPMVSAFVEVRPSAGVSADQAARLTAEIVDIGAKILICAAVFQLFDAVGIIYIGALRGAGDTLWPMLAMMLMSWTILLGGGLAAIRYFPQLTSLGPWIAASIYVILLGLVIARRFESGAWRKIDLLKAQPSGQVR